MRRLSSLLAFAAILPLLITPRDALPSEPPLAASPPLTADGPELLDGHCVDCHSAPDPAADLDLEAWLEEKPSAAHVAALIRMKERVLDGTMPPPTAADALKAEDRARLARWMEERIVERLPQVEVRPGRVTVRRLSREEYGRTVRALFGVDLDVARMLPADDLGYGFDNVGDALSVSQLHLEKYAQAAAEIAYQVFLREDPDNPEVRRIEAEAMSASNDRFPLGEFAGLFSRGTVTSRVKLPRPARYRVRIAAAAQQAGPELAKMRIAVGRQVIKTVEVEGTRKEPSIHEVEVLMNGGPQEVHASFINDYYDPKAKNRADRDRNLYIDWCEVVGPLDPYEPPAESLWVLADDSGRGKPERRARPLIERLASRAWRRPAKTAEVQRLARLVRDEVRAGRSFEEGFQLAFEATLVSPHFLFRLEPGALKTRDDDDVALNDHALATRLSYFLWSAPPDETLSARAASGDLDREEVLVAEARRLLSDPRAEALATNFAAQWLELRNLATMTPDPARFPSWSAQLAASMREETERLFLAILREKRDVRDLLRADFTHVDRTLAAHYGLNAAGLDEKNPWKRVSVPEGRAPGIVGHASFHALTSNPTRTSPVKRGKWVMENLLDQAPPPPPPGADSLEDEEQVQDVQSLRESLARHRADASCASCHARMDGLGLTLEGYDVIGRPRSVDAGQPVDTRGELPDGRTLAGAADLALLLAEDPAFLRCLAKKLFVHAVGRAPIADDRVALERLVRSLPVERVTLEDLVLGIIRLDAFARRDPARKSR